ncbi:hypothetical protein, partial [Streptomyces rochei]|uniref:hypothetical protein n=1 Tax=Streptomyces rochei TaxID=1928 RepID=UPI0036774554
GLAVLPAALVAPSVLAGPAVNLLGRMSADSTDHADSTARPRPGPATPYAPVAAGTASRAAGLPLARHQRKGHS